MEIYVYISHKTVTDGIKATELIVNNKVKMGKIEKKSEIRKVRY